MALVAYDNSDSSEYEDEENDKIPEKSFKPKEDVSIKISPDSTPSTSEGNLFNLLPQPSRKKQAITEEDDEFLHKKENNSNVVKPKAKITVPSLNDFKDVKSTTSNVKPKQVNGKKCGLLSILPQPKNGVTVSSKSLIPHVLTQKPNSSSTKKKEPLPLPLRKANIDPKPLINDSDDSDDDVQNDFFSINKPIEAIEEIPVQLDQENTANSSVKKPFNIESYFKNNDENEADLVVNGNMDYLEGSSNDNVETEQMNNDAVLDEEAIMKLCGARGKRKREDIQIVDVNQKEVLANAKEWLLKGLMDDTTKRVSASKKKGHEPTTQQKRKHQITYLAFQAKANEAELQNQWANSRMSRRKTQSKYGF